MFKIDQLVIIAGPSAVGKTTILNKIKSGEAPNLCDQLSIDLPSSYRYIEGRELYTIRGLSIDRLILHYDFMYQYAPISGFNYLTELINHSNHISVLTLYTSSDILLQRIISRLVKQKSLHPPHATKIDHLQKIYNIYKHPYLIIELFEKWSTAIDKHCRVNHLMLNSHGVINSASSYNNEIIKGTWGRTLMKQEEQYSCRVNI
jgi:hypothetical protein